jgi:hypothetical protein
LIAPSILVFTSSLSSSYSVKFITLITFTSTKPKYWMICFPGYTDIGSILIWSLGWKSVIFSLVYFCLVFLFLLHLKNEMQLLFFFLFMLISDELACLLNKSTYTLWIFKSSLINFRSVNTCWEGSGLSIASYISLGIFKSVLICNCSFSYFSKSNI